MTLALPLTTAQAADRLNAAGISAPGWSPPEWTAARVARLAGSLRGRKVGRGWRIPVESIDDYIVRFRAHVARDDDHAAWGKRADAAP